MVVTEKCDVYSFGVVALEILMGKHPVDLLSSLTSTSTRNLTMNDVLDPRLSGPIDRLIEWDIVMVMRLAFSCISSNPKSRPTMQSVSQQGILLRLRQCDPQLTFLSARLSLIHRSILPSTLREFSSWTQFSTLPSGFTSLITGINLFRKSQSLLALAYQRKVKIDSGSFICSWPDEWLDDVGEEGLMCRYGPG
ncbi:hypothetical protein LguiA_029306 [Lonicera macranthoides]